MSVSVSVPCTCGVVIKAYRKKGNCPIVSSAAATPDLVLIVQCRKLRRPLYVRDTAAHRQDSYSPSAVSLTGTLPWETRVQISDMLLSPL